MRLPPYRKASHIVDEIQHHVVWITKPRKPALHGETATRLRKFMRETCGGGVAELLHHTKAVGRGACVGAFSSSRPRRISPPRSRGLWSHRAGRTRGEVAFSSCSPLRRPMSSSEETLD